jgi:hypothetical protein
MYIWLTGTHALDIGTVLVLPDGGLDDSDQVGLGGVIGQWRLDVEDHVTDVDEMFLTQCSQDLGTSYHHGRPEGVRFHRRTIEVFEIRE